MHAFDGVIAPAVSQIRILLATCSSGSSIEDKDVESEMRS